MERQAPGDNSTLESSLTDLILNSKSEKIRRPPNAFMLFARDHRRIISKQHPEVSNKVVSSMLGKFWKSTGRDVKEKYYNKAKLLGDLHKRRFPDYVYSPREARIQKMNKKKKKDEANSADAVSRNEDLAAVMELTKRENNSNEEEWITDTNNDPKSSPEYIPNNPEYFAQQSPEIEDDPALDLRPRSGYSIESQYHQEPAGVPLQMDQGWTDKNCRWSTPTDRCGCCNQNRLGPGVRCAPPFEKRESEAVVSPFPEHRPCSYATASPFCNPPPHFTGPMSSYCCGPRPCSSPMPRPYGPPLHPYWNPPIMNSTCYPGREYFYEDLKPYPFSTPYHAPDFHGPYGYYDRPFKQPKRNFDSSYHPHLREDLEFSGRVQNGLVADSSVPHPYFSRSGEKEEKDHCASEGCSRTEDEMILRNRRILRSDVRNKEQMVHQNQVSRTGITPQDASSAHVYMPISGEGGHFNNHPYPNTWVNHSSEDKSTETASTDPVSAEDYQCDSIRNGNKNSSELANNSQGQSEEVLSSTPPPECDKRKLDALYADDNDSVASTNRKMYRLSIIPTTEATRTHLWTSAVAKSPMTKNKLQEINNKPTTALDQPIYSNPENNISATSSNKRLFNTNEISPSFFTASQDKNCSENIIADKQGVPLIFSFSKVPTPETKERPNEFDSSGLQSNQIQRKNPDISENAQQSQVSKPHVKMEFSSQGIYPANEKNFETGNEKNNQENNTSSVSVKMGQEAFTSASVKQENMNSIRRDQTNIENNAFVSSNRVAESIKARSHILANMTSHPNQSNMTGYAKQDLSKVNYESLRRPNAPQEHSPGFFPLTSQSRHEALDTSRVVADPGPVSKNLHVLQPFIKMENNENTHF